MADPAVRDRILEGLRGGAQTSAQALPSAPPSLETPDVQSPEAAPGTSPVRDRLLQRLRAKHDQALSGEQGESGDRMRFLESMTGPMGRPGMKNLMARGMIAQSDTRGEALANFKKFYPNGELAYLPSPGDETTGGTPDARLVFREDESQPFRVVDAEFLEGGPGEVVGDLVDMFAEDLPALAGEVALTARTRGANLMLKLAKLAGAGKKTALIGGGMVGAGMGEAGRQAAQTALGVQGQTIEQQRGEVATQAGMGVLGTAGGMTVAGMASTLKGAGVKLIQGQTRPGIESAMEAQRRLNLPRLLAPQVSDSPLLKKLAGQAGAVLPAYSRYLNHQITSGVETLRRLRDKSGSVNLRQSLAELHDRERLSILSAARKGIAPRSMSKGGQALQEGVAAYDHTATAVVDTAYKNARAIETPQFDFERVLAKAEELASGSRGLGKQREIAAIDPATGQEVGTRLVGPRKTVQVQPLAGDVRESVEIIRQLSPEQFKGGVVELPDGTTTTGTEVLRWVQQRLWDTKTLPPQAVADPETRRAARQAGELYREITNVLDNPLNTGDAFRQAWSAARTEAAKRFDTLEKLVVIQAARTETPAQLATRLGAPGQVDNLKALRNTIPADKFSKFQESWATKLLDEADSGRLDLAGALRSYDQETLDILLSPHKQAAFASSAQSLARLDGAGIQQALQAQTTTAATVRGIVDANDGAGIEQLVKLVQNAGGRDSPAGRQVRAGILNNIVDDVTEMTADGLPRIRFQMIEDQLRKYDEAGALKLLRKSDVSNLLRVRDYARTVQASQADSGTSLQAGEAVAGLAHFKPAAVATIIRHMTIGRLLLSENLTKVVLGTGAKPIGEGTEKMALAMAQALAFAGDDLDEAPRQGIGAQ